MKQHIQFNRNKPKQTQILTDIRPNMIKDEKKIQYYHQITKKHFQLLIGAILGFVIVDGIAIIAGTWVTTIIPIDYLKIISAIVFIIIGILMIFSKDGEKEATKQGNPFFAAFLIIMLTVWGDKTQIVAAIFATQYDGIFSRINWI